MANSGQVLTNTYNADSGTKGLQLDWWIKTTDRSKATTTIAFTLKGYGTSSRWHKLKSASVRINDRAVYTQPAGYIELRSGTVVVNSQEVVITHDAAGNGSFSVAIEGAIYTGGINCKGSGSFTLPSLPRVASLDSAPNITDEDNPTITYSNPAGTGVTLKARVSRDFSTDVYFDNGIDETASSYTFAPTEAQRDRFREMCKDRKSMTITYYLGTDIPGVSGTQWKSLERTLTITNCQPTISPFFEDIRPETLALTGDRNIIVLGESNVSYAIGPKAYKKATITDTLFKIGTSTNKATTGVINGPKGTEAYFYAADSRGYYKEYTHPFSHVDYIQPTISLDVNKPTLQGELDFSFSGSYFNSTFGAVANQLTLEYQYSLNGGEFTAWAPMTPTLRGNSYEGTQKISGFGYKDSITVRARLIDKLHTVLSKDYTVRCLPIFDWGRDDFNFNVPISYKGKMVPIVIEDSIKDGWQYRLWSNGRLEMWYKQTLTVDVSVDWGNILFADLEVVKYPFTFRERPYETISIQTSGNTAWLNAEGRQNTTTQTGLYSVSRAGGSPGTPVVDCIFYINGFIQEAQK